MASGSFYLNSSGSTSGGGYLKGWLSWEAESDIENNKSKVTVGKLQIHKVNTTQATTGTWYWKIWINGSKAKSGSVYTSVNTGWVTIGSASADVLHNSDGTKTVKIYAIIYGPSGTSYSGLYTSASKTVTLDTIPRASTVTALDANIGSATIITIGRAAESFTDAITYSFGSLSGVIAEKTNSDSVGWTVPETFYAQMPDAKSGKVTITCTTYNGDTKMGTSTCTMLVTAAEALCAPSVSGEVRDVNAATVALTGDDRVLVRYQSMVQCSITAAACNGATIVRKAVDGTVAEDDTVIITLESGRYISFSATDSRGYVAEDMVGPVTVVQYVPITNNARAARRDPVSGNVTLTLSGGYYNGSFGANENALTVQYRKKQADGEYGGYGTIQSSDIGLAEDMYTAEITLPDFDYASQWELEVVVSDKLMSVSRTMTINKGIPVFDWGENDFNFHVPVSFDEKVSFGAVDDTRDNLGLGELATVQEPQKAREWIGAAESGYTKIGDWVNGGSLEADFTQYSELIFAYDVKDDGYASCGAMLHVPTVVLTENAGDFGVQYSSNVQFVVRITNASARIYKATYGGTSNTAYKIYCYGRK